ncbi:TetR/AcrR family transcriptional regulator [Nocardia amikacinitolerans]|uniref:TetR/AcrR family transcriptional regulator n=1 Tax=Nocardia amikacinitolerans TaxID=756689 RepID=UPI0020A29EC7|nr:TetR/AcrR family transcriptional regulator [Nocardia amikacinitolerans]MCP2289531.1 transcriptional regulator, TetR family [Nocardia amikacinitolerans]
MTSSAWSVRAARERSHTDRHRDLLDAAARVFAARGYAETTVAAITAEAGVARATLYVYFASKEEIFQALAARVRDNFLAAQEPGLIGDDPRKTLRATIEAFAAAARDAGPLLRMIEERGAIEPALAGLATEIAERPIRRFARWIERQRKATTVAPVAEPRVVAETIGYAVASGALARRDTDAAAWREYLRGMQTVAETLLGMSSAAAPRS